MYSPRYHEYKLYQARTMKINYMLLYCVDEKKKKSVALRKNTLVLLVNDVRIPDKPGDKSVRKY